MQQNCQPGVSPQPVFQVLILLGGHGFVSAAGRVGEGGVVHQSLSQQRRLGLVRNINILQRPMGIL